MHYSVVAPRSPRTRAGKTRIGGRWAFVYTGPVPEVRGSVVKTHLDGVERDLIPGISAALEHMPAESLEEIRASSIVSWVDMEHNLRLNEAIYKTVGLEPGREFFRVLYNEFYERSVFRAFLNGIRALGASDPGAYTLVNADIVENTVTAGDDCHGGGLRWFPDGASDVLTVTNVTFTGNACTGATSAAGQAVSLYAADAPTVAWTYNNIFDQPTDAFDGMDDPTGNNGNVSEDPKYVSTSGTPSNWDLRLSVRSDLVDLGDPSILDADGTTSDIGAYGGPAGEDW